MTPSIEQALAAADPSPLQLHTAVLRELDALHDQLNRLEGKVDQMIPNTATNSQRISSLEEEVRSMKLRGHMALWTAVGAILTAVAEVVVIWATKSH